MTRLTKDIREAVCTEMLQHRFSDTAKKLVLDKVKFAEKVYNDVYSKSDRTKMDSLPDGWLRKDRGIYVQFGTGKGYCLLSFSGHLTGDLYILARGWKDAPDIYKRVLFKHYGNCAKMYAFDSKFTMDYQDLHNRQQDLLEEVKVAKKAINTALGSTTTVEALVKLWPESEPFLRTYMNTIPKVPSIPTSQLNNLLDLPV